MRPYGMTGLHGCCASAQSINLDPHKKLMFTSTWHNLFKVSVPSC